MVRQKCSCLLWWVWKEMPQSNTKCQKFQLDKYVRVTESEYMSLSHSCFVIFVPMVPTCASVSNQYVQDWKVPVFQWSAGICSISCLRARDQTLSSPRDHVAFVEPTGLSAAFLQRQRKVHRWFDLGSRALKRKRHLRPLTPLLQYQLMQILTKTWIQLPAGTFHNGPFWARYVGMKWFSVTLIKFQGQKLSQSFFFSLDAELITF